jgi:acyl dehydratase
MRAGSSETGTAEGPWPLVASGLTRSEFSLGARYRTSRRTLTETDLVSFVALAGFTESLFLDAQHGTPEGGRGRLIPGALTLSVAEGLFMQANLIQRTGMAFASAELRYSAPVYVGDTLEVRITVTESRSTRHSDRGIVTTRNQVANQCGEIVLEYTATRMIRETRQSPA